MECPELDDACVPTRRYPNCPNIEFSVTANSLIRSSLLFDALMNVRGIFANSAMYAFTSDCTSFLVLLEAPPDTISLLFRPYTPELFGCGH